jgi:hypothetical protein
MAKKRGAAPDQEALLKNWNTLNEHLLALSEEAVAALLAAERAGRNRLTFVLRLHSRLNRMRRERERSALARAQ